MKRSALLLLALFMGLILIVMAPVTTFAQEGVDISRPDGQTLVTLDTGIDSTATVTSEWFQATKYLGQNFNTYPVCYTKLIKSTKGKPRVTTTIEGSNDQTNIAIADTMGILADSIETYQSGTLNLNNKKYLYYRIKHTGTSGNRSDVTSRVDLLFTKP